MTILKALILAGGFGTRLRPLSCTRPKILFPILNKPLIEWILEGLAQSGVEEAILAVNSQTAFHLKHSIFSKSGLKIVYSCDPLEKPLGTGGPVRKAEKILGKEDFLVINGDIFTNINYMEIAKTHKEKKAVATIAVYSVEDPFRYGVAELANDGRIKRFIEKPSFGAFSSNIVNAGIYVLSPEIFSHIPEGGKFSLEREVFPKLAEDGRLYGHIFKGLWADIGKIRDYFEINKTLLETFPNKRKSLIRRGFNAPLMCGMGSFIGEKSIVGPYAILGRNVRIGKNVCVRNSILFNKVSIGDSSFINGAIIGENVTIGENVKINKNCVIGDYAIIGDGVTLKRGTAVCPAKEVFESVKNRKCIF